MQYCTWGLLRQYRVKVRHRHWYWYWYHIRMLHWDVLWSGHWCTMVTTSTTPQTPEGFPHIHLQLGAVALEPKKDENKVDEPKNNDEGEDGSWNHWFTSLF